MMSFSKVLLTALYASALTVIVEGKDSIASGGGAGGGSNGRFERLTGSSASTSGNTLVGSSNIQSSLVTTTTVASTGSNANKNTSTSSNVSGKNTIESSVTTTISNVGSSSNVDRDQSIASNTGSSNNNAAPVNNNSNVAQNFGTHGTLADRPFDVMCPICDAVSDKSYNQGLMIQMGGESWSCGYLQETVQDVDQFSQWEDEAGICRQSQLLAEDAGCCAQTMYIDLPGENLNNPCSLCGAGQVPTENKDKLVNTGLVGSHTCGGIEFAMLQGVFSSNMCPQIIPNIERECCFSTFYTSGRSAPLGLRGAVVP